MKIKLKKCHKTLKCYSVLWVIIILIVSIWYLFSRSIQTPVDNPQIDMTHSKNAYFAGWCFWCMEWIFEAQEWVYEAVAGYIWWDKETATYDYVLTWQTGHREWVKIIYDPEKISYASLVDLYWTQIDPTDDGWQFSDRWFQYTTAIYYDSEQEKNIAENSKKQLESSWKFGKNIATKILPVVPFYDAEEYHQDYYKKSSLRYSLYKKWSGREKYIKEHWWDDWLPSDEELKEKLTPLQYKVTQKNGTERAFDNEYWDNKEEGIYVDIVDGTPLYSSLDKYDSWTGWPSFTRPINMDNIYTQEDNTLFSKRTEVRSKNADSHLWHVFWDGPVDEWWLRYCMNSAAMKFISVERLEEEWYGEYLELFQKKNTIE